MTVGIYRQINILQYLDFYCFEYDNIFKMERRIREKQQFEIEYFNKTFKGFFVKKVAQIIQQQPEPQKIFAILDLQANLKDLFYKSLSKQRLDKVIKQQLMPFVGALKEKLDKTDAKVKILKQIIFIQFYIWFLDTQVGAKKALSIKQLQNIKKLLTNFKIQSQFQSVGAAQDYFNRVIDQLHTMGRFNYRFKQIISQIAQKNEFQIEGHPDILAIQPQNQKPEKFNPPTSNQTDPQSLVVEKSNPGKTSITSIHTPGKSSQNRSAKSSPQHSLGRTVFMSHPMRFRAPQKPAFKIITEYFSKQTDCKTEKVQ